MRKVWIGLCAFLCMAYAGMAYAAGTPQSVLDARAGVVPIEVYASDGKLLGSGSGFAIGVNGQPVEYIVTNDHVGGVEGEYCVVYSGDYMKTGTSLLFTLPEADLCVLKLDHAIYGMPPLPLSPDETDALTGQRVYALGFPASAAEIFSRGKTTAGDVTVTDGMISAVRNAPYLAGGGNIAQLQINVALSGGNSGGPLLDENGWVVGVNAFGAVDDANMYGAIAIRELFSALEQHGIAYQKGIYARLFPWWAIALVIAAAIGAAVFVLLRKRGKRRGKRAKPEDAPEMIPLSRYVEWNGTVSLDMALYLLLPVFQKARENERAGRGNPGIYPQNIHVVAGSGRAELGNTQKSKLADGYSAPEQYKEGGLIGGWTHVYQLGALLYYVLAGMPLPDIIARYEDDAAAQDRIGRLHLTDGQRDILKKAVDLKASNRYVDINAMMEALSIAELPLIAAKAAGEAKAAETNKPEAAAQNTRRLTKGKKRIAIILASAIVVGGVGAFLGVSVSNKNRAVELLNQYVFEESYDLLKHVPAFLSPDMKDWTALAQAGMQYDKGEYAAARAEFEALGDFGIAAGMAEKSAEKERERLLTEAESYIMAGNTKEAAAIIKAYQYGEAGSEEYVIPEEEALAIEYNLAELYNEYGYFGDALNILNKLSEKDYEDAKALLREIVLSKAAGYIEKDKYITAYEFMRPYQNDPKIEAKMEKLVIYIYELGIECLQKSEYLQDENENNAKRCFEIAEDYLDSKLHLTIINSTDVFEVLPYITAYEEYIREYVKRKIHNPPMISDYLVGQWRGDGRYFNVKFQDGHYEFLSDIPWIDYISNGIYYISDGVYYTGGEECFKFIIGGKNFMFIHAYKNDRIYWMTRQ